MNASPGDRTTRGTKSVNMLVYAIPLLAGVLNALHSGTNAELNASLGRPWWAAVAVCAISGAVVLAGAGVTREPMPHLPAIATTPWWAWAGAAIAAVPVISSLAFAEQLGGAAYNGLVVTATILSALVLDHFGLLGFAIHKMNVARLFGSLMMLAGLTLICLY